MKDATEIVCVIDKSGSMAPRQNDAIGGFNHFLQEQQKLPGEANLTVVLFDTEYSIWPVRPIKDAPPLDAKNYVPSGATALLDALGKAINQLGVRLGGMPEDARPDKVIFVIITDGEENSSHEFTKGQISDMVKHQIEKYNWQFLYLGANVDAFSEAQNLGIMDKGMVACYAANAIGTRSAYEGTSEAVSSYRSKGLVSRSWKSKIKDN